MKNTDFEIVFRLSSYFFIFCGFISLWLSDGFGFIVGLFFIFALILSWFLENSKKQLSDRQSKVLIFVVISLFYIFWKYNLFGLGFYENILKGLIGPAILILGAIKLLQKKSDKDWIFIYLISFFLVLLAAGLSISPLYLTSFILYLLVGICTIITFEIKRASSNTENELKSEQIFQLPKTFETVATKTLSLLLKTTICLLLSMIAVATPIFFLLPRLGGAGLGTNIVGFSSVTGFSDSVALGAIGQLKQNDAVVMRVKVENNSGGKLGNLHWRGVALDFFDNKIWSKSGNVSFDSISQGERDSFQINYPKNKSYLTVQTFYLEPIDTPVVFALASPIALQGKFQTLVKDSENSLNFPHTAYERSTYKVYSDQTLPDEISLKKDNAVYSSKDFHYLRVPENTDKRIAELAGRLTEKASNRYDKAKTVENYLQNNFGYTLELKSGGEQPLADFLFNIREGHCEYFATAMAVMLRTQGIATRIVNGFQEGDYNETADVYVVRQKNAHSWVEVYFPGENVWIPFDPTPFVGQNDGTISLGTMDKFNNYIVALETFWIQYFVSYDNQEQRSLLRSIQKNFGEYREKAAVRLNIFRQNLFDWWRDIRGDKGFYGSAAAVGYAAAYTGAAFLGIFLSAWLYRKTVKFSFWQKLFVWVKKENQESVVEFYQKMQTVLASRGLVRSAHQTPLEFAFAVKIPEAVSITEKYNRVKFGKRNLSKKEIREIEAWLKVLSERPVGK